VALAAAAELLPGVLPPARVTTCSAAAGWLAATADFTATPLVAAAILLAGAPAFVAATAVVSTTTIMPAGAIKAKQAKNIRVRRRRRERNRGQHGSDSEQMAHR